VRFGLIVSNQSIALHKKHQSLSNMPSRNTTNCAVNFLSVEYKDSKKHNLKMLAKMTISDDPDNEPFWRQFGFKRIQHFRPSWMDAAITQYESQRTGLQVVTIEQQSPLVIGEFMFATQPEDDSGAPHTLEHLVFFVRPKYTPELMLKPS
jgi:hypothetical protein